MEHHTLPNASVFARRTLHVAGPVVITAVLLIASDPAIAQETRADSIRQQQADRQRIVAPPTWNRAEVFINRPRVGYTGGWLENPTYHDTHDGKSGHAEAVRVSFDTGVGNRSA